MVVKTDASAAKGIACRKGLGKVRHIKVNELWVQDRIANEDISIKKINGKGTLPTVSQNMLIRRTYVCTCTTQPTAKLARPLPT